MGTWTLEEEIVLAYYITRNITYASIIEIMAVRCGTGVRNIKQISEKVVKLRKHGVLEQKFQHFYRRNRDQHWNIRRTDRWILLTMSKAELDILLDFNGCIAAIIDETNDLGRFLNIMHINEGGKAYWPSRFNLYYEYQSLYHFDHLYQPENPAGMDTGTRCIDDAGQVYWPSHFNQHYELPTLSPIQSPHHLDHLYRPENTGWMDTGIQCIDDGGQPHWRGQLNQHYESQPYQSVYQLNHLGHLGHLDQ